MGVAAVTFSSCFIAYVSIVGEALNNYALSQLMELIPEEDEARIEQFENLTRREDEFIQVASIAQIIGIVFHFAGWSLLIPADLTWLLQWQHLLVAGSMSVLFVVVCVIIIPPWIVRHRDEAALLVLLPGFALVAIPFRPLTAISSSVRRIGARLEGVPVETAEESFQEDLADSLEEAEREGLLDEDERAMIHKVVELGQTPASKAMIPRTDMICADVDDGLEKATELAIKHGHSRIPVFEGDVDHIVGIFYTRDLIPLRSAGTEAHAPELRTMIRPAKFWPESKPLDELLREMRSDRLKIAILADEHGGTAGMITLEDILEEIVGEIEDEYDEGELERAHRPISPFTHGTAEVDGDVDLDEANRVLEINLPEDAAYVSVGGFFLSRSGRLPKVGEQVEDGDLRLTVIDADEKRIKRLQIERLTVDSETEIKR